MPEYNDPESQMLSTVKGFNLSSNNKVQSLTLTFQLPLRPFISKAAMYWNNNHWGPHFTWNHTTEYLLLVFKGSSKLRERLCSYVPIGRWKKCLIKMNEINFM